MTADTTYILDNLDNLIAEFPHVRARYECDKRADVHFIEIVPNEVYHLDDAYIAWENEVTDNFIERFPTQNICFISDDAIVGIRNAEYCFEGLEYAPISSDALFTAIDTPKVTITQTLISDFFGVVTRAERSQEDLSLDYQIPSSSDYRLAA